MWKFLYFREYLNLCAISPIKIQKSKFSEAKQTHRYTQHSYYYQGYYTVVYSLDHLSECGEIYFLIHLLVHLFFFLLREPLGNRKILFKCSNIDRNRKVNRNADVEKVEIPNIKLLSGLNDLLNY